MRRQSYRTIPPLGARLAAGRPVLDQQHITALTERILSMTSAPTVNVSVTHTAQVATRMANGHVLSGDDGDFLQIRIAVGMSDTGTSTYIETNQLDDTVLHAVVQQCEQIDRDRIRPKEDPFPITRQVPDPLVPVQLWHDETVRAMNTVRSTVLPDLLGPVARSQLRASGFVGFMARSETIVTKEGISVYYEETDSEVTVTARGQDDRSSGWDGQAARNWDHIDPEKIVKHAVSTAKMSANPVAVEPGRRTAILSAAAVAQIIRFLGKQFEAAQTDQGGTGFSSTPPRYGSKTGQRVFDSRVSMWSDPNDSEGGYCPYFDRGYATPAMTWVENGILKNLAYDIGYANTRGKRPYAATPDSIRVSGGATSLEEMIAQCREGIYVNRFSNTSMVDSMTGLITGVTRDGCFLVKNGKIEKSVKNFRFLDSPFFFLNKVDALGIPVRAAMGYTLSRRGNRHIWPLPPIIVPPMMVRDFNFSALSDAI
jgi:predicted Zn-dependent protease